MVVLICHVHRHVSEDGRIREGRRLLAGGQRGAGGWGCGWRSLGDVQTAFDPVASPALGFVAASAEGTEGAYSLASGALHRHTGPVGPPLTSCQ